MDELIPWARDEVKRLESRFEKGAEQGKPRAQYWCWRQSRNSLFVWVSIFAVVATSLLSAVFITTPWLLTKIDYQTQPGEQRKIVLPDGSLIHLNTETSLNVDYRGDIRKIELVNGEALFNVVEAPSRAFIVDVAGHNVAAVGTTFNLQLLNAVVAVAVVEGQVAVREQDANRLTGSNTQLDRGILLDSGQAVEIDAAGLISEVASLDTDAITAWDRGIVVFDKMPLRQAAKEMSRYMVTDIRVVAGVPDHLVTGRIQTRDQLSILSEFAQLAKVTPVRQSAQLTLLYSAAQ